MVFTTSAQSAMELVELLGKRPSEVDLKEYLGNNIDTLLSATWRYTSKETGVMVQAHIDQYDPENTVITTITLYFTKDGYAFFQGDLPFDIRPSKSWNKNRTMLANKTGFTDLEVVKDIELATRLQFKTKMLDQNVFMTALYLHDEKGVVQRDMYSLQFSILKWEE